MEPSTPIVLSMSDWARPGRELTTRSLLGFLYLCLGLVVPLLLFAALSEGGTGLSWVSAVLAVVMTVLAAGLARLARGAHRQLREIRAGRQRGDIAVFPDHCRIHFPGVLAHDLVLPAGQVRAICVDDRRPAWAALYWFRFPIAAGRRGPGYAGCLFRPHLRNALQLLAPTAAVPNVAVLFDHPLRLEHATGLGQAAEPSRSSPHSATTSRVQPTYPALDPSIPAVHIPGSS